MVLINPHARPPLVIVPGMFGTRLLDARGAVLWGSLARLYRGPPLHAAARPGGLIGRIAFVDVHASLLGALARAGFRDVHVLDYDWRHGYQAGAAVLAQQVARLGERVDLLAISTGGGVVRRFLGHGRVRRVVYLGAPQLGSFDALACLQQGYRFAPLGRRFPGRDAALWQTTFDALPQWDVLGGRDLYDPLVWRQLGLCEEVPGLAEKLARARRLHAQPCAPHDAVVIGARNLPTPARMVMAGGVARVPRKRDGPDYFEPGDGSLGEASLRGLPGSDVRLVEVSAHARLPAHRGVHRLVIEALSVAGEELGDEAGRVEVAAALPQPR